MSNSKPHRSFARIAAILFFSAVLFLPVFTARAEIITYNIVDYPDSQAGISPYTGEAHVTGSTITVNFGANAPSPTGTQVPNSSNSSLISATLDIQTSKGLFTDQVEDSTDVHGLMATPTQLYLPLIPPGSGPYAYSLLYLQGDNGLQLEWVTNSGGGSYEGDDYNGVPIFTSYLSGSVPSVPGGAIGLSPMLIGTVVPEPGTLTLLASALLGLGVVSQRRRRAKG